ncbi:MAG: glutamate synthase subunit alpha, partial [Bifidobacterium longum]|nr:glutamate synthase subunit alpha [Bifidobacterium longum]
MTFKAPLDLTVHAPDGMYDPSNEHDACGVGMVTTLNKRPERKIVTDAIEVLVNLDHRGAVGAEENTGDGAGILMSMPDEFMRATVPAELPEAGHYAAGIAFLDRDIEISGQQEQAIAKIVREEGLEVLAWRVVPTNPDGLGLQALAAMPGFKTLVVASPNGALAGVDLDRKTFRIRKRVEHEVGVYFASLSARTITYKGMLTTMQLTHFFEDLNDECMKATIAIVHSRFSTNTFPSWPLAQPFRLLAHNGEINTIQGNRNWLSAREGRLSSELLGEFEPLLPYNNTLIEPWDGPADIVFTDGTQVGALLDRNGFRPGRWQLTDDGYIVLASEAGVIPEIEQEHIVSKGRLEPGKMFLVDTAEGRIIPDEEVKKTLASQHPYRKWVEGNSVEMSDLPRREHVSHSGQSVQRRQRAFGYTEEDLKLLLTPMANTGKEPLGSMGNDAPMPALSSRSRMLFDYFTQKFAQVTNPPLDWEREEIVTSLESAIGPEPNLLSDSELHAKKILIPLPVVNSDEMAQLKRLDKARILGGY